MEFYAILFDAIHTMGRQALVLALIYIMCNSRQYYQALEMRNGWRNKIILAMPFFFVTAIEFFLAQQFNIQHYGFGFLLANVFCVGLLAGVRAGIVFAVTVAILMNILVPQAPVLWSKIIVLTLLGAIAVVVAKKTPDAWRQPRRLFIINLIIGTILAIIYEIMLKTSIIEYWHINVVYVVLQSTFIWLIFIIINRMYDERNQNFILRSYQAEMAIAGNIQECLLPKKELVSGSWNIYGSIMPCKDVGGDLLYYAQLADGENGFVIGDVTDKGMPAAVFMSFAYVFLTSRLGQLLPADALVEANDSICAAKRSFDFITTILGQTQSNYRVLLGNAGHCNPMLFSAQHKQWKKVDLPKGLPLGVKHNSQYKQIEIDMDEGDVLLLYSDGLTDLLTDYWQNNDAIAVLNDFLQPMDCNKSAQNIYNAICAELVKLKLQDKLVDDTAIMLIKRQVSYDDTE